MDKKNMQDEFDYEELAYEVSILLEGMLYFAGVKKENLRNAANTYVEIIDDVLAEDNLNGVDEPIKVVNYMKEHYKEYF